MNEQTVAVLLEVEEERTRQNEKWGEQNHDHGQWLFIFMEELGEVCKAETEAMAAANVAAWESVTLQRKQYRRELVQSAAVLVAMIESYDRNAGATPEGDVRTSR